MKKILETERIVLREFILDDAEFIIQLVNSPGWITFIGDRNIKTVEAAKDYIQTSLQQSYVDNGFGLWCCQLKTTTTPIGMCGLVNRPSLEHIDIGFALLPEYEKQGFGYEMAKATMNYAFETLQLRKIVAITDEKNKASIKLLHKIGLTFEKKLALSKDDEVLLFS